MGSRVRRHRVRPVEAEEAMADASQWPLEASHLAEEDREAILGLTVAGRVLVVVYTVRGDAYRVVTTRSATRQEARLYRRRR